MDYITIIGTILGIAAVQFFRDYRDGKNVFKKNESLGDGFQYMKHHYNDTLTQVLTELQVSQKESVDILRNIERNGVRVRK